MNKNTITCEQMAAAFYSREPIGDYYITDMMVVPAPSLPDAPHSEPNKIYFVEGYEMIIFTLVKKA